MDNRILFKEKFLGLLAGIGLLVLFFVIGLIIRIIVGQEIIETKKGGDGVEKKY